MMFTRMRARRRAGAATALLCGLGAGLVLGLPTSAAAATAVSNDDEVDTAYGRMMLVLDSSGSMAEKTPSGVTRIAAAKTALGEVVDDLPDEAAVGLRVYGATVFSKTDAGACTDSQQVVEPGTDNREDLRAAIASYEPYGETPIGYALREAAKDIGGEGNRSIVLVSDGEATCAPDPCEVASEITRSGIDLQVDVVGLDVTGSARKQLQCVAENGNGTYYDADDADELADSLDRVAERAVRPFTFSGTPIDGSSDPATPTPITAGEWTDEIGPDRDVEGNRYYTFDRTMPGSTVHFSATTTGNVGSWDGVFVEVGTPDGSSCGNEQDNRYTDGSVVLGTLVTTPTESDDPEDLCRTSQTLLIEVGRDDDEATENAPMALKVMEEPPVDTVAGLPLEPGEEEYVAPQVNDEPVETIGGQLVQRRHRGDHGRLPQHDHAGRGAGFPGPPRLGSVGAHEGPVPTAEPGAGGADRLLRPGGDAPDVQPDAGSHRRLLLRRQQLGLHDKCERGLAREHGGPGPLPQPRGLDRRLPGGRLLHLALGRRGQRWRELSSCPTHSRSRWSGSRQASRRTPRVTRSTPVT